MLKISSNENAYIHVSISRRVLQKIPWVFLLIGVSCFLVGIGFYLGCHWNPWPTPKSPEQLTAVPDRVHALKLGPWGNMESLPISIEPPEEYLSTQSIENADRRWWFKGCSPEQVHAFLSSDDLSAQQKAELLDQSKWEQKNGSLIVSPSKELILSLSPKARKRIYGVLGENPENLVMHLRCSFPADHFNTLFSESDLPPETVALIKHLSFPHGRFLFFCDVPSVLDSLKTYEQKICFMKCLTKKETLLLKLHVMPDSDVNLLVNYWSKASWGKDVKPMLESLAKVPGGARLGVVHLLPPMPTESLYTYPFPSTDPADVHKDCHWTALNFFRDPPDPRFTNADLVRETIQKDYYPVLSDPRYGDVIMLARPDGSIVHSAVFIADNIVYTKNSPLFLDPFLLMTISDMIDRFEAFIPENEHLKMLVFRNKYY
ncbi:MAG: hypothetical protein NTZ46_08405 [Verrucomicrobia bacterium]|nr:hypothetical protein [Verrucomicrobiota bacterium]